MLAYRAAKSLLDVVGSLQFLTLATCIVFTPHSVGTEECVHSSSSAAIVVPTAREKNVLKISEQEDIVIYEQSQ